MEKTVLVIDAGEAPHPQKFLLENVVPEIVYFANLGEKTVAADVEAIALVGRGPGDAAHHGVTLKHDRLETRLHQFKGGGKPRRTAARHDDAAVFGGRSRRLLDGNQGSGSVVV